MTATNTTAVPRRQLTALRASWLYDGISPTLLAEPVVLLDGDTIIAVGTALPVPAGAAVVDLAGATLLPGLIDGHVHLVFDSSADPVASLAERDDAEVFAAMISAARTAARGGVTTVRDLGDRDFLSLGIRDVAAADPTMPELLVAGPPITTPGGHCHFLGEPAVGAAGIRAAIAERAERGVDVIKIMASGGHMTPGSRPELSQYERAELRVAVAEAHRYGLAITAHAHGTRAIVDAVTAGVDGLEHITFVTADDVDEIPDDVLAAVGRGEITLGMTLGMAPAPGAAPPPGMLARMPRLVANGRRLFESGARMIAGTDAGIAPIKPPDVIRWAVAQFQQLGMTPAQSLHSVTAAAAGALGLGDRKGRLAAGYDADILAVNGDPLSDPAALHRIRAVYLRGHAVPR
jgi:imidazolonepropionase-like amidohydrolase